MSFENKKHSQSSSNVNQNDRNKEELSLVFFSAGKGQHVAEFPKEFVA